MPDPILVTTSDELSRQCPLVDGYNEVTQHVIIYSLSMPDFKLRVHDGGFIELRGIFGTIDIVDARTAPILKIGYAS